MVPELHYEDFSRQFRPWKKECTESTQLMTKIKSFKNNFLIMENFINPKQVYADLRSDFMFKKAFGQKHIMIPFLNAILKIKGF